MNLPAIITRLPEVALPFPSESMRANLLQSENGQVVFFEILKDSEIPPHSHGGQWGIIIEGRVDLTINGEKQVLVKGSSYFIPAGAVHSATMTEGTKFLDFFEEPTRHKAR